MIQKRIQRSLDNQRNRWRNLMPDRLQGSSRDHRYYQRAAERLKQQLREELGTDGLRNIGQVSQPMHPSVVSFLAHDGFASGKEEQDTGGMHGRQLHQQVER
jgi:type II secretory pathway component PulJ